MNISTDELIFWKYGFININATIIYTWIVIAILTLASYLTRRSILHHNVIGKYENFFEILVEIIKDQIKSITETGFDKVFPFVTCLFMFILTSNLISLIPSFYSPTASLSTTFALVLSVVIFSAFIGIKSKGLKKYLSKYTKPIKLMAPFIIVNDIISNFSMAFRLYGNIMSGGVIATILVNIKFLSVGLPIILNLLSLISGIIQAYVFSILSVISLASSDD